MKMCKACKQFITVEPMENINHPDAKRILAVMEKHNLTLKEIADLLNVSYRSMYRWIKEKDRAMKPIYFEILKLKGYL